MRVKLQRKIAGARLLFSLFSLLWLALGAYLFWSGKLHLDRIVLYPNYPWWYPDASALQSESLFTGLLFCILAVLICTALGNLGLLNIFFRTASPEIFFTIIFLISLSMESLRIGVAICQAKAMPVFLSIVLTRCVYLGRFMALIVLLVASLFAAGMKYTNYAILLGGLLLLAFALANIVPVDPTRVGINYLFPLGDPGGYNFVNLATGALILINYAVARRTRGSTRFLAATLAVLMLFAGKELLYFGVSPLPVVAGLGLILGGVFLFSQQIGVYYLGI